MVRFRHRFAANSRILTGLAGPLVVNYLAVAGFNLTDTLMAGRLGVAELAAVGIGDGIWMVVFLFAAGILTAINPITAQAFGADKHRYIGHIARQSLWLAFVIGIVVSAVYFLIRPWFGHLGIEPEIVPLMRQYLDAMWWGMPAVCLYLALRHISDGVGHTKAAMVITSVSFLLNIVFNWVLMFGHFGMPAMGVAGCGLATAIVLWLEVVGIFIYVIVRPSVYGRFGLFDLFEWPSVQLWREIATVGVPIGISFALTEAVFAFGSIASGALGTVEAAAHNIVLTFVGLVFM
ncbi:MAG: MATE family efflux transporter, partial [Gammaproteobacteria bacterium]|nr:MATE family efflux transporter [Gammaproteobacteria bacterium]